MMILPGGQRRCMMGVLILGLVSCGQSPHIQSPTANPTFPPAADLSQATPDPTAAAPGAIADAGDIWSRLRQAETHYYVLMRHAIAPGTGDPPTFELDDCATQRNLSEAGREQARRAGETFRENTVTVRQVLSSEWCRCLDTATLLDLGPVERFPVLNSFFEDRAAGPEQTRQLRDFMVNHRDQAGVTVLVTHFVNIAAIAGGGVASGEMVVMRVNDGLEPEVVGQFEPF